MKKIKILSKLDYLKLFIVFSFIVCWLSISTSFFDLLIFKETQNLSISKIINFLRHIFVYICLAILLFIIIRRHKNLSDLLSRNLFLFFLIIYFSFQIPGIFLTENDVSNLSFTISSITSILSIILIREFFSKNEKIYFIFISLIVLFSVFLIAFIPEFISFLKGDKNLYGGYIEGSEIFLSKDAPRSSGISRTALIIILLLELILQESFKDKKKIIVPLRVLVFTIVLILQSRTVLVLTFFYFIFFILKEYSFTIKNIFKIISIYIILPIFFTFILFNIYSINGGHKLIFKDGTIFTVLIESAKKPIRKKNPKTFSSGRVNDWKEIISKVDKSKFIGFGSQADRYLINQTASNGIIYALSSSGILGLTSYLFFSFMIFVKSLQIFFYKKYSYFMKLNFLVIIIILARSVLESSYAVFGIDLLILLTCSLYYDKLKFIK